MRRIRQLAIALCVVLGATAAPARAGVIQELPGLAAPTNGIVLGPGGFWVSEELGGSVVQLSPTGQILRRFMVGNRPTSLAVGPDGRVWVSVTGSSKLTWFDATSASPTAHDVPVTGCGPAGIVAMAGRMYFSQPADGSGCTSAISWVDANNPGTVTSVTGRGQVFDLEQRDGKLFAPDFSGGVTRRLDADMNEEAKIDTPGNPDGVAISAGGNVHVTDFGSPRFYRFASTSNDPAGATRFDVVGGGFNGAFGVVAGADGRMYFTASASHTLMRLNPDATFSFFDTGAGTQPWQIVNGTDGDLYFTDTAQAHIFRYVDGPPRVTTGVATAVTPEVVAATASADPRGNDTTVLFDYGTTTAYGATSAPVSLPAGPTAVPVQAVLSGLKPSTTYHVRARASSALGSITGADVTVTTPAAPVVTLRARANFSWLFTRTYTILTKVRIEGLAGGETARLTCTGKRRGCPFAKRTFSKLKKGTRKLDKLFRRHKLKAGAKLQVRVTRAGTIGSVATLTIRRGKDPKIVRRCLPPGASAPKRCS